MIKNKDKNNLDHLRHSTSHLLAAAVLELYPDAKPTLGPSIEDGFYYDFDNLKVTEDDLPKIEKVMHKIVKNWRGFEKDILTPKKAKELFKKNKYKLELIDEHAGKNQKISIYTSGDFTDLCGGGHIDNPSNEIKYFKLLSIAGAYWRGSEKNKMLTRIYGTAFPTEKELIKYLKDREEAEKRNHRKLGKELELFEIFPEIGQGLPVWLPKGFAMRKAIEDYMFNLERENNYKHVFTPHISRSELFEISGHLGFYKDSMYPPLKSDEETFYLKPMNCPAAMMIYKMKLRSYKDLPLKLGEMGTVYRYEKSGELHGLQRVRGFTQNDAHIFCTKDQLLSELNEVMRLIKIFYKDLGFKNYKFVLATSDPGKEKYKFCGTKAGWKWAEGTLRKVLKDNDLDFEEQKGEAAFYGPKIDILAVNVFGKADAISTNQVDFNLPDRFDLSYINPKGEKERPYVVHRALIGSFERFFAFLIEYYAGSFPLWFSPVQVKILPITDRNLAYSKRVGNELIKEGLRVELDDRSETLGNKIRLAQSEKVPYMLVIGDKEENERKVAVRLRTGEDLGKVSLEKFKERVTDKISQKSLDL